MTVSLELEVWSDFLLEPQLLALEEVVVGIEDPGDVLCQVPVQHRLQIN